MTDQGLTDEQMNGPDQGLTDAQMGHTPAPAPDLSKFNEAVQNNLTKHLSEQAAKAAEPSDGKPELHSPAQKEAKSFFDAVEAGFQMSVDGLIKRHQLPDTVLPEHADWFLRTGAFAGETFGDLKSMAVGGAIGGVMGAEGGPVGAVVGAAAAGFGLPPLMRQALIQEYQKGSIKDFQDFWTRASGNLIAGLKGAATGAGTELAGLGGSVLPYVGGKLTGWAAKYAAMTNIGTALDGHVAGWQDYLDSATALLGFHAMSMATGAAAVGAEKLAGKLGDIYAKTGKVPQEVVLAAKKDPVLMQDLVSSNVKIPEQLKPEVDPQVKDPAPTVIETGELHPVLTGDNGRPQNIEFEKPIEIAPGKYDYIYAPMDVSQSTEGKVFYHGTKEGLNNLSDADVYGKSNVSNLYGEGLYLTDNPNVAEGYSKTKGKGPQGQILAAQLNKANLVDLERPLPENARKILNEHIAHYGGEPLPDSAKGKNYYAALKEAMAESGLTTSDAVDVYQGLNAELGQAGYDGLRHQGGGRIKGRDYGPHNVAILFEDSANGTIKQKLTDVPFDLKKSEPQVLSGMAGEPPKAPPPVEPPAADIPEHPMDKQIDWGGEGKKAQPTISFRPLFTRVLDQYDPIKQAGNALKEGKSALKVINDPYWLKRLTNSADTKARYAVMGDGPRDIEGNPTGTPSLAKILEPHMEDRVGFTRFLVAATNLERAGKGIPTGFQIEGEGGIRDVFNAGKAKYGKAAKQITQLMNDSLDKLAASGVIPEITAAESKGKWEYYSPQNQAMPDNPIGKSGGTTFHKVAGKEMGAKVADPIERIARTIYARERLAARNEAVAALANLVDGKPSYFEDKDAPVKKVKAEGPDLIQESELNDPDTAQKLDTRPGEVTYFENGKRVTLRVPDEVARAFKGASDPQSANLLVQLTRPFAQLERSGAINSATFVTRHVIRAEGQAPILSTNGYIPVIGFMRGLFHTMLGTDVFKDAEYMGALHDTVQSLHDDYIAKDLFGLQKKTGMMDSIPNLIKNPAAGFKVMLDKMARGVEVIANAPRVEEYRLAMKGKERTRENMLEAAKAGREVLPDSSRIGSDAAVKAFSQVTPFWNVHMQGSLRLAEALKDRPVSTVFKGAAMVTLPSMLLWYHNRDDKDVQETDNYTRDMTWQFPVDNWQPATAIQQRTWPQHLLRTNAQGGMEANNKTIYKVPKPFEPGVMFGSLFERMADYVYKKNPRAFDGFDRSIEEALKFAPLPAYMAPVAEQWANKSLLTGAPIVPERLQGLLPKAQYTDYTSETAKQIGSLIGHVPGLADTGPDNTKLSSPMVVENYVRSWTGGTGQLAMRAIDALLEKSGITPPDNKPDPMPADTPYVGAFKWRYPTMNARSVREFFDRSAANKRELDTVNYLMKKGEVVEGLKTMVEGMFRGNVSSLDGIKTATGDMQKIASYLDLIPDQKMPKSDKRQLTDGLMYKSIELAQKGNEAFDKIEAQLKEKAPQLEALKRKIETMEEQIRRPDVPADPAAPAPMSAPAAPQPPHAPAKKVSMGAPTNTPAQGLGTSPQDTGLTDEQMNGLQNGSNGH